MPRIAVPFGQGLDRETGIMSTRLGGMEDLRNVHALDGKYQVRRGFEEVMTFTDPSGNDQTHVLAGIAVLGKQTAIYVTYDDVNAKVNVWYGDGQATWYAYLGEWTFEDDATTSLLSVGDDPPVIVAAEMNGTVLLAHDKNDVDLRAQTAVITQNAVSLAWELNLLTVNWSGSQNVRFRGVVKHIEYICGWGWGTDSEDRPEFVRVSDPGLATTFGLKNYWIVGDEGDPVIACYSAGEKLIAFKETQTWELFGDSRANFGYRILDALYGMLYSRLAVSVEGAVFAWTNEGPRLFTGRGTSISLDIPLEITLPEHYDLPTKGDDDEAFCIYIPVKREVWWVFGKRAYSLSIRAPDIRYWKWGYETLGFTPHCGFRLPQAGFGLVSPPTGYPSSPTASGETDTTVDIEVTLNSQDGDETLEFWARPDGDSDYTLWASYEVGAGGTQSETLTGLDAGWEYDVAVRLRRGSYYTAGYESDDPDLWPSSSRTTFTTTMASTPTINSAAWSRTSASVEKIQLTITPPYTGTGYDVEIRRGGVLIETETDVSGVFTYDDTGCTGEASNSYDCRLVTPYVNGSYTGTTAQWAGPPAPTIDDVSVESDDEYDVDWTNGGSFSTEVYDSLPSELEVDVMDNLRSTEAAGEVTATVGVGGGNDGLQPWVGVRHKATSYGVDDYSDISAMQSPDVII